MSRPKKCRKVCCMPLIDKFVPFNCKDESSVIELAVDEFEAIRLIDKEGFSQEECSQYMNIARATVQNVYNNARKKIADALVLGLPLYITGGEYTLCSKKGIHSLCSNCKEHNIE